MALVDPIVCTPDELLLSLTPRGTANASQSVRGNGGTARYLAMDEPIRQRYPTQYYILTRQTGPGPKQIPAWLIREKTDTL